MASNFDKAQEAQKTCDDHERKELSFFCRTCKKFICITCGQTSHHGHVWDLISSIAKVRRSETPKLCRQIKSEKISACYEKLRTVEFIKRNQEEVRSKLEERRSIIINLVNRMIDEEKEKSYGLDAESKRQDFEKKLNYVEKMTTRLDSNIAAYNDFDLLEMEQAMIAALAEVESYNEDTTASTLASVPEEINEEIIRGLIGRLEENQTNAKNSKSVCEIKTIYTFKDCILTIASLSNSHAWVGDDRHVEIRLLQNFPSQIKDIHCREIERTDFIALTNGDFILTHYPDQVIRRITSSDKVSDIVSTKPLHPGWISKTQAGDILVSMRDDGDDYKLRPSSRRLVQRMTLTGKVLNTYEFQEDGVTRLFTWPVRMAENGNSDICVVNRTSSNTGDLFVLHIDGRVRATYRGQDGSKFNPADVACDSKGRILVLDFNKENCLHLLSPDGTFLRYLLSDMSDYPETMTLYKGSLWIGFQKGAVTVYKYSE